MDIRDYNEGISYTQSSISQMAVGLLGKYMPANINVGQEATLDAASKACQKYFEKARRVVLARHTWSFAMKEDTLSEYIPKDEDKSRLSGGHLIPADCVRVVAVGSRCDFNCSTFVNEGHEIRENLIFPCCGKQIRYIYDNILYYQWSDDAITAFTLLLCRDISSSINADPTLGLYHVINNAYEQEIATAIALDSYTRDLRVIHDRKRNKLNRGIYRIWRK